MFSAGGEGEREPVACFTGKITLQAGNLDKQCGNRASGKEPEILNAVSLDINQFHYYYKAHENITFLH